MILNIFIKDVYHICIITEGIYFVTYRLYGSIHPDQLKKLQKELESADEDEQKRIIKKYDKLLDKAENKIFYLNNSKIAEACIKSIMFFEEKDIEVICYCIMPNHVHLVFKLLSKNKLVGNIMASDKKILCKKRK